MRNAVYLIVAIVVVVPLVTSIQDIGTACVNKSPTCRKLAKLGECDTDPHIYSVLCPRACGTCSDAVPCKNPSFCQPGATCRMSAKDQVACNCPRGSAGRGCRAGARCFDRNLNCQKWASEGYCNTQANFMEITCPASCNSCHRVMVCHSNSTCQAGATCDTYGYGVRCRCDQGSGTYDQVMCKANAKCMDWNLRCPLWAERGRCNANNLRLFNLCPLSCGVCDAEPRGRSIGCKAGWAELGGACYRLCDVDDAAVILSDVSEQPEQVQQVIVALAAQGQLPDEDADAEDISWTGDQTLAMGDGVNQDDKECMKMDEDGDWVETDCSTPRWALCMYVP